MAARPILIYAAAAIFGVGGASVAYAPASIAAWLVAKSSGGTVTIAQPSGTLWAGSGDVIVQSAQGIVRVPHFSWTLMPGRLWRGELAAAVLAEGPEISGSAEIGRTPSGLWLRNMQITAPLTLLTGSVAALQPLGASGRLTARTAAVDVSASAVSGSADVLIEHAQSARYGTLGDYRIALEGATEVAKLNVTTLHGPLHIDGNGELSLGGQLRFRGQASVDAADRERFNPILSFIGVPRPDGSVPLEWPLSGAGSLRGAPVVSVN